MKHCLQESRVVKICHWLVLQTITASAAHTSGKAPPAMLLFFFLIRRKSCVKGLKFEPENREMKHCLQESRVLKSFAGFFVWQTSTVSAAHMSMPCTACCLHTF